MKEPQVAHLVGVTEGTIRRWRRENIGPPFRKVGGRYEYREDLVLAWQNGDKRLQGLLPEGFPSSAEVTSAQARVLSAAVAADLVQRWKDRELRRRADVVFGDYLAEAERFNAEREMVSLSLDDFEVISGGKDNAEARKAWFKKEKEAEALVNVTVQSILDEAGYHVGRLDPANVVLSNLVFQAWREIIWDEGRWRNLDFSSFPKSKRD